MNFTEEQQCAIDISRLGSDACVVAGPGSGKTTVLVERYRQLVESGVEPNQILAITFTEKAAANMRDRLARAFASDPEKRRKLERAQVSTIHGFCARLLKEHALAAGIDPEFVVLDEQESGLERSLAVREALDAMLLERREEMLALIEATDSADLESLIPSLYEAMRSAGVAPRELVLRAPEGTPSIETIVARVEKFADAFPNLPTPPQQRERDAAREWLDKVEHGDPLIPLLGEKLTTRSKNSAKEEMEAARIEMEQLRGAMLDQGFKREYATLVDAIVRFDVLFRNRKTNRAGLDFNDLEWHAVRLLDESAIVRDHVHEQFIQIITDEFQDTSGLQAKLLSLLCAPGSLYAVGDLNQSIFGFRHATPAVFRGHSDRVKNSGGHHQELVENWRSREPILQLTVKVLNDSEGITPRELIAARELPEKSQPSIEVLAANPGDEKDPTIEPSWLIERILSLRSTLRIGAEQRPARFRDVAVIARTSAQLEEFAAVFEKAGLPYNLNRRQGFFETREALDLLHLLRMIVNPLDDTSTLVVLRSPFCGLSDEGLLRLRVAGDGLWHGLRALDQAALDPADEEHARRFLRAFEAWRVASEYLPTDRLLWRALDEMGISVNPATPRGANIEKFTSIARKAGPGRSLRELTDYMEAVRDADERETDAPLDDEMDAVQMMTAHAAKGLEFPVVILPCLDRGVREAESLPLNFTPQHGLGVKWNYGGKPVPGAVHFANAAVEKKRDEDESNRLLYVALTRAEEHLILSWTGPPHRWAKKIANGLGLGALEPRESPETRVFVAPDGSTFGARIFCPAQLPDPQDVESVTRANDPVELVKPPPLGGQFDPNTTATGLSLFASCPRKFYLGAKLGWRRDLLRKPNARGAGRDAAEIGTEVHQLLAGIKVEKPSWEATRLAANFDRSESGRKAARAKRVEREWDFIIALGELIVQGSIDLWFEEPSGLVLVDYKTDDVGPIEAIERARSYAVQLGVYALALERATRKKVIRAEVYFLRPDVGVPVLLNENEAALTVLAQQVIAAQESGLYPMNIAPHCARCEFYRSICPARIK